MTPGMHMLFLIKKLCTSNKAFHLDIPTALRRSFYIISDVKLLNLNKDGFLYQGIIV